MRWDGRFVAEVADKVFEYDGAERDRGVAEPAEPSFAEPPG